MKFLALIPARYASTRFPGKPLADIKGKPMIQRVYERVSRHFDACYVATDDVRIESAVSGFGGNSVMTSNTHRSGTDRCAEALDKIETVSGEKYDVVINIQGDEPFIADEHLEKISQLFDSTDVQIGTLVKPFSRNEDIFNSNSPKVVVSVNGNALYFSRSAIPYLRNEESRNWQSKHTYFKHIGMYAYRSDVLRAITRLPQSELEKVESLEQLRWLENGYQIKVAVTQTETIAVDTPEDLKRVVDKME